MTMEGELGRVLEEATAALAQLDADALQELERRALALRDAIAGGAATGLRQAAQPKLVARLRVFASVVAATGKDLSILERAAAKEQFGAGARWVR